MAPSRRGVLDSPIVASWCSCGLWGVWDGRSRQVNAHGMQQGKQHSRHNEVVRCLSLERQRRAILFRRWSNFERGEHRGAQDEKRRVSEMSAGADPAKEEAVRVTIGQCAYIVTMHGGGILPPSKSERNVSGIPSADVQVPSRVQETLRLELVGLRVQHGVAQDGPGELASIKHVSLRLHPLGTHHIFTKMTDPPGMMWPSYSSSARLRWGPPMGAAGCHRSSSFTVAAT